MRPMKGTRVVLTTIYRHLSLFVVPIFACMLYEILPKEKTSVLMSKNSFREREKTVRLLLVIVKESDSSEVRHKTILEGLSLLAFQREASAWIR